VEQSKFVPLNATLIILVNAVTGIIIWEDWRVVQSWIGTVVSFALLGIGCDLLLTVPLLNSENAEFGVSKRVSMVQPELKRMSLMVTGQRRLSPLIEFDYDEDEEDPVYDEVEDVNQGKEKTINADDRAEADVSMQPIVDAASVRADRRKSRVLAWKEVMNLSASSLNFLDGDDDDLAPLDRSKSNLSGRPVVTAGNEALERTRLLGPRAGRPTNGRKG
jgi:hypothetical protein